MRVLQAKTKWPLDVLAVSGGHVAAAASSFDARGGADVWDVATGTNVFTHSHPLQRVTSLAFSPDAKRLYLGAEQGIAVLDSATGASVGHLPLAAWFPKLAMSCGGTRLLVTTTDDIAHGHITCFGIDRSGRFRTVWSVPPRTFVLYDNPAFSPDEDRVAVAMHDGTRDRARNNVQLRDAKTGVVMAEVAFGASDPLEQIVFSADGSLALARCVGRVVKVFDAATGKPAGELVHPGRPFVTGMAVHPDGTLACSRNNGTVCLWNLERRELLRTLDWKIGKLVSVAFSHDASIGAAGSERGEVVVWDVDS